MGKPKPDLDKFLRSAQGTREAARKRCLTCQHPEAATLVKRFMQKVAAGETTVAFRYFYDEFLSKVPRYTALHNAARHHVVHCLKLDLQTGRTCR